MSVESSSGLFVLQLANGSAWLFSQHSGAPVQIGDLLSGYVDIVGFRVFAYDGGFCRAYREAGPLSHSAVPALARAPVVGLAPAGLAGPSPMREEEHVHRSQLS